MDDEIPLDVIVNLILVHENVRPAMMIQPINYSIRLVKTILIYIASRLDLSRLLILLLLLPHIPNSVILPFCFRVFQIPYFLALRIVLPEIFDHEAAAALDDVVQHLFWAALTDA